ncbi:MAG: ribosome-associated translation inhibitor RaiA [Candidatus Liptonbacteria bacterium]|nr:ribosome-associated translation inhibitor RaiA [Candidatus Liptonbacteria bacterium]
MRIHITEASSVGLTPSLRAYIEEKIGGLSKFVRRFDLAGVAEVYLEVSRTTRHHHKGNVFRAEADLRLPGKILRAFHEAMDLRIAIDILRSKLRAEIEKYRTRYTRRSRCVR